MSIVPAFRFACERCGHCCSGGDGFVWLADGETARMAAALAMTEEAFMARHVRDVVDPRTGERRRAVRGESAAGGRCALLVGANACSVYAARPEHCCAFPFWSDVLATSAGFEAARAVCPGIAVEVEPSVRTRAFAVLVLLYAEVDAALARSMGASASPARCCLEAASESHELFATGLEADYAASRGASGAGCALGAARPLGCRLGSSGALPAESAESFQRALRAIERETGYPAYGRLAGMLAEGRTGIPSTAEVERR